MSTLYHRDDSLPYWKNNVAIESIIEDFAIDGKMPGHFEMAILSDRTYSWTFTPNHNDEPVTVIPVYDRLRLVDILAVSANPKVWGCVTGAGAYVGTFSNVLHVHDTPASWLADDCNGILPLAKSFFPLMNFADSIVARNEEHAEKIANEAFIYPAERFGLDCFAAEQAAKERISF